ncbi:MAG TPA: M3 family metallopeptidase, partial [Gemmatimonadaceae bacterium]|nr:M3 family metallopeptidase [Gemmatimonadaceae bacterium]
RNFFPTPAAEAQARRDLVARAERLGAAIRRIDGARALYRVLASSDTVSRLAGRHYAYLSLRNAIDTRDAEAQGAISAIAGQLEPVQQEVNRILGSLPPARLAQYETTEPRLGRYRYAALLARRDREHRLDSTAERTLAAVEASATTWGPALFQTTLNGTPWGTVQTADGPLDFRRNGNEIRNHRDRAVREHGYRLGQQGIESRKDIYAFILTRQAAARNAVARERRWADYPTQFYAAGDLTPAGVRTLLASVAKHAELNKRYERARIAEVKRDLGYDTVHVWDITAPSKIGAVPRFTIVRATERIQEAAEPLGEHYRRELRALLDPANGRLDLVARPNRVDRPGFSTGSVGYPSMFFQGRFEGYVEDLVILGHEAGHAVQNMLMDSANVLPRYAGGPSYFTESFATLSQLLLLEHLVSTSRDSIERRYFQRRVLEDGLELFRNAHESLIELQMYDSVAAGRLLTADGMEQLTQSIGVQFSSWFGAHSERRLAWVQPIQFFTWPLYRVNYVIAKLLALRYLDLLHQDPAGFQARYESLLSNGYDAPPAELLKRFLGLDLSDTDNMVAGATRVLEHWLAEYAER